MTIDKSALRAKAQHVIDLELTEDQPISDAWDEFEAAANPAGVLALLAEIHSLECRLEVSEDTLGVIRGCLKAAEGDIDRLKAENEALREANDKLSRRNGMLEENVTAMTETHVLYTWLRKKADQPGHGVIAVAIINGPEWVVSHDLDKDLRALIDAEEP
jgi:hypothetical protein